MKYGGRRETIRSLLRDNIYEEYSKFSDSEDDFHRSDSDIHPNDEDNWEVCDAGNHTCAARGYTNSVLSDDLKQFVGNDNDLP